ncbi:MAG TPA: heavy-metal-associated domain-containing protein [Chitinophagaceae bacterium]|nr:heavy-metal-associated domain-containing protein [Chitinophagaceae bacterium]
MKTQYIVLSFLFILVSVFSASAQFKSASLQAAGLTCAMCTKAINKSLEKVSFIKEVEPDIKTSSFLVTFREGASVDFDVIKKAVEDAGFSVASLKVTGKFDKVSIQNDAHVQIDGKTFHFLNVNKQTLQGEKTITLVDRNFVSAKDYRKYSAATSMACVKTGRAQTCCAKEGVAADTRIYHVTI